MTDACLADQVSAPARGADVSLTVEPGQTVELKDPVLRFTQDGPDLVIHWADLGDTHTILVEALAAGTPLVLADGTPLTFEQVLARIPDLDPGAFTPAAGPPAPAAAGGAYNTPTDFGTLGPEHGIGGLLLGTELQFGLIEAEPFLIPDVGVADVGIAAAASGTPGPVTVCDEARAEFDAAVAAYSAAYPDVKGLGADADDIAFDTSSLKVGDLFVQTASDISESIDVSNTVIGLDGTTTADVPEIEETNDLLDASGESGDVTLVGDAYLNQLDDEDSVELVVDVDNVVSGGNNNLFNAFADDLRGGDGNDILVGDAFLNGPSSNEMSVTIDVSNGVFSGNNNIFNAFDDLLNGGAGNDLLVGDLNVFIGDSSPFELTLDVSNVVFFGDGNQFNVFDDGLIGGDGDDELVGDLRIFVGGSSIMEVTIDVRNFVEGGSDNSFFAFNDMLDGGAGNDFLVGDISMIGGSSMSSAGELTIDVRNTVDSGFYGEGNADNNSFTAFDDMLEGGIGDDTLVGDVFWDQFTMSENEMDIDVSNVIQGGSGFYGEGGSADNNSFSVFDDILDGGPGADLIVGDIFIDKQTTSAVDHTIHLSNSVTDGDNNSFSAFNDFLSAGTVDTALSVFGFLDVTNPGGDVPTNDVDFYRFTVSTTTTVFFDIDFANDVGSVSDEDSGADPMLSVFDPDGRLIAFNDDNEFFEFETPGLDPGSQPFGDLDPFIGGGLLLTPGTYTVAVSAFGRFPSQGGVDSTSLSDSGDRFLGAPQDTTFVGDGFFPGQYFLQIRTQLDDVTGTGPIVVPGSGGVLADQQEAEGSTSSGVNDTVATAQVLGTLSVGGVAVGGFGATPSIIDEAEDNAGQAEDNDTFATAQDIPRSSFGIGASGDVFDDSFPRVSINGEISFSEDVDFYRVELFAGETVIFDIDGEGVSFPVDTQLFLFDADGFLLAENDDSFTTDGGLGSTSSRDSFLPFTVTEDGFFFIAVDAEDKDPIGGIGDPFAGFDSGGTDDGNYVLNISIVPGAPGDTLVGDYLIRDGGQNNDISIDVSNSVDGGVNNTFDAFGDVLLGGPNNDLLVGDMMVEDGASADIFIDVSGNGDINLFNDHLCGFAGNDVLYGDFFAADGGSFDITFNGLGYLAFLDSLDTEDFTLTLFEDVLDGFTGNDDLIGGFGDDTLIGGFGDDTFLYGVGLEPSANVIFSTASNNFISGLGTAFDEDLVKLEGGGFSLFFDGSANSLTTTSEDLDAVHVVDVGEGDFIFSIEGFGNVPGVGAFGNEDLLLFDASAGTYSLFFDGSANGFDGEGPGAIDALFVTDVAAGSFIFSTDTDGILPDVGSITDDDLILFDGTTDTFSLFFDGSAHGFPTLEDIDALFVTDLGTPGVEGTGSFIFSTETNATLPDVGFVSDEDLVLFDGATDTYSLLLDSSDVLEVFSLDALHVLSDAGLPNLSTDGNDTILDFGIGDDVVDLDALFDALGVGDGDREALVTLNDTGAETILTVTGQTGFSITFADLFGVTLTVGTDDTFDINVGTFV